MREIKFRGKITNGFISGFGCYRDESDKLYIITDDSPQPLFTEVTSIDQYTGLKDKNEKEIYEGDIVKVFAEDLGTESICEMKWIDHGFSPTDKNGKHYGLFFPLSTYKLEVIGNIYENPELLKQI